MIKGFLGAFRAVSQGQAFIFFKKWFVVSLFQQRAPEAPYGSDIPQALFTVLLLVSQGRLSKPTAADPGPALLSIWRSEQDSVQIFGSEPGRGLYLGLFQPG